MPTHGLATPKSCKQEELIRTLAQGLPDYGREVKYMSKIAATKCCNYGDLLDARETEFQSTLKES
jgi:hypothetical protein